MDFSNIQTPEVLNQTNYQNGMDKITIKHNAFSKIQLQKNQGTTIVILELNFSFFAKQRLGPIFNFGQTQEVKFESIGWEVNVKNLKGN